MHVNEIEVDIGFRFHCPMTGAVISAADHLGPSPATAFLLAPGASDFDHLAPGLEAIWRDVRDGHDAGERSPTRLFEEFRGRLEAHRHLVLFSLTTSGIACGPVRSTVHVCIDFSYLADGADDGLDGEGQSPGNGAHADTGDDGPLVAAVPLPRHLPSQAFATLLVAYQRVARDVSDEPGHGPIDMLVGYRDLAAGQGFMALEYGDGDGEPACGPPLERMKAGEKLAIQLHDGPLAHGVQLIDGHRYRPTRKELRGNAFLEAAVESRHPCLMPHDTGFYALGVGLDGNRLSIEPIAVDSGLHGESLVRPAVFPESLRRRIAAFLAGLA